MSANPFGLAIVGAGRWGLNHVRTAAECFGKELRAVVDLNPERAGLVKEISPEVTFTSDLAAVLNDSQINAIVLATPAETHFTLASKILKAGKHVLVEKPVALYSRESRTLEKIAARENKILMVGHVMLYHAAIQKIKALIDDGTVGKLQYIYSNRLNLGTVRKEENILWSFAPHDISILQYLIGTDPLEVEAKGGVFLQPDIHDVTLTSLVYPNNIRAHIHVSWLHPFKEQRLVVIGDRSMLVFEDTRQTDKLILYPKGIDLVDGQPVKRDDGYEVVEYEYEPPLKTELEHFRDCVVHDRQPLSDGANGTIVLDILERAQLRLESKDPKQPEPVEAEPAYFVHPSAVVDDGCAIGNNTKIWHYSHVQSGTTIGESCSLGQNVNVGNNVTIGSHVKIQNNVSVYEGVELEDYVFCGPSMVFTNVLNPRCEFPQRGSEFYAPTLVRYGASIGANATIVCGNTIGRFAFIGAGAVVVKDVPEYALMVGNPARQIGWVCRCGKRLELAESRSTCRHCKREYQQQDNTLICTNEGA